MSVELKHFKDEFIQSLKAADRIFIVGHNEPDFDSIGSAIGVQSIATALEKEAYIIVNDNALTLEPGVKKIIDENKEKYHIITLEEAKKLMEEKTNDTKKPTSPKSLLVVVDNNKDYRISPKDMLGDFNKIIVIDHHEPDVHSIESTNSYINTDVSSTSEIIANIIISERLKMNPKVASYLLAGICLDTKRFKQNTSSKTHDIAEKLLNRGANSDYVNELFREEFESFCKINSLIINGTVFKKYAEETLVPQQVSFTINREAPTTIYRREEIAKAADRMLKFDVDAAFVMGYNRDGNVLISARSLKKPKVSLALIGQIEAGTILQKLDENHCGGNAFSAGGEIPLITDEFKSIFEIEETLMAIVEDELNSKAQPYERKKVLKFERKKV